MIIISFFYNKKMKILIIYATTEGQTRKIARFMEDELRKAGHQILLCDATDNPPAPDGFDAILIGASIHIAKYQSAISHYITKHVKALNQVPGAFFSVSLSMASHFEEEHDAMKKLTEDYLEHAGWKPVAIYQIAGALKYTQYDLFKRMIMKSISKKEGRTTDTSHDHEFTDWEMIATYMKSFIDQVNQSLVNGH